MAKLILTDEEVEREIERLQSSEFVRLTQRYEFYKNRRRQYLYDLVADAFTEKSLVQIKKSEYEALVRESETLRTITELFRRNTFMPEHTIRVMLGLGGENPDIVTPGRFEKEPPKEGKQYD